MSVIKHFTASRRCKTFIATVLVTGSAACFVVPQLLDSSTAFAQALPAIVKQQAFDVCVGSGLRPDHRIADRLVTACSEALQSGKLTPDQVALARLNRGAARVVVGDRILAREDYQEALKHYESAINPKEPDALALYRRAVALGAMGDDDRALADYGEAIRIDPHYPQAYYERGVLLASHKRAYLRAIADFDRVLELEPKNVDGLMRRGDARAQMGDFGPALVDLDRAVQVAPERSEPLFFRGLARARHGESQLALDDFNKALVYDARNVDALVSRAAIFAATGKNDLAIRDLDTAVSLRPNDPLAFYNRGYSLFAERRYEQAIADYGTAISLDPRMGLAYNNRCLARAIVGRDLVDALADCDKALKLNPTNMDVRQTRGFIYLKLGDPAIAIVEYDEALKIEPNRALALYGRGIAKIRMGQKADGEADQSAARALVPGVEREFSLYGVS